MIDRSTSICWSRNVDPLKRLSNYLNINQLYLWLRKFLNFSYRHSVFNPTTNRLSFTHRNFLKISAVRLCSAHIVGFVILKTLRIAWTSFSLICILRILEAFIWSSCFPSKHQSRVSVLLIERLHLFMCSHAHDWVLNKVVAVCDLGFEGSTLMVGNWWLKPRIEVEGWSGTLEADGQTLVVGIRTLKFEDSKLKRCDAKTLWPDYANMTEEIKEWKPAVCHRASSMGSMLRTMLTKKEQIVTSSWLYGVSELSRISSCLRRCSNLCLYTLIWTDLVHTTIDTRKLGIPFALPYISW